MFGDSFGERWPEPFEEPLSGGGVLDGEGYQGTYDGPRFDGHSKVHVWRRNQLLTFELGRIELLRLAAGRPVKLATIKHADLFAEVTPEEARRAIARRAYARVLRGVARLRNRSAHEVIGDVGYTPMTAEQTLAPWLMAIIERLDALTRAAHAPAPSCDHDERCKDRREMLYALALMLREGGIREKVLQTHGWDAELLARVREVVEWVEEDKRQHVQAQAEN